jgi:hypothetical protein
MTTQENLKHFAGAIETRGAFAHKLQALHRTTFSAYQLADPKVALDPSKLHHMGDFDTLVDAQVAAGVRAKQHIMVRERDEFTGRVVEHFYAVKQRSQPIYVRKPGMAHSVQERPLYLEHLFSKGEAA